MQTQTCTNTAAASPLVLRFARTPSEVREAQRLRHEVFAGEMGARMPGDDGLDADAFDPYCEHLLVRESDGGRVVGTYRILSPEQARRAGGYYSEQEFDLGRLHHLRGRMVEIGRSCVHPDYRSGGVITLLWSGLLRYMSVNGYDAIIGCASVSMQDGGQLAVSLYNMLKRTNLSPSEYRVFPRCELPLAVLKSAGEDARLPPLIKGYVRIGAYVCGAPAWDPDFNTADLLMMLPMSRIDARYAKHFLKAA